MKKPNYNEYTIKQLKEALSGIDGQAYPEILNDLKTLLEKRRLEYPEEEEKRSMYASFLPRFLAYLIDILFLVFLIILALLIASGFDPGKYSIDHHPLYETANSILALLYCVLYWAINGKTPGKSLIGIMIINEKTGAPPGIGRSLARYIGYFISSIPIFLGFLWLLWHPKRKTWHDMLSGTVVVWEDLYLQDKNQSGEGI